ncbi:Succinate-semialdehyde dehydrogenase [Fusarium oxysporum f. sp. albedinis]|nr:Succinate-semialdehyde dehydrogenase [Fusarium oxysporum f. sp. albedinis]
MQSQHKCFLYCYECAVIDNASTNMPKKKKITEQKYNQTHNSEYTMIRQCRLRCPRLPHSRIVIRFC